MSGSSGAPGQRRVVGISELCSSAVRDDVLVTFSLGSCLGVAVFDAVRHIGGMIHCMLPSSTLDPDKARARPAMFVDTGVTALLNELYRQGARREDLVVKVAGGAAPLDQSDSFRVGERNCTVLRKILWKNDLLLTAADVGGSAPRTLTLWLADGRTTVKSGGTETELR